MRRRLLLGYMSFGMLGVKLVGDRFEKSSAQEISSLPQGWQMIKVKNIEKLRKQFLFPDFIQAFSFMTGVAIAIEKFANYSETSYPEIFNVYNQVVITLPAFQFNAKFSPITIQSIKLANHLNKIVGISREKW
jgi:pterin-4a-carbinolamine dehydratase